MTPSRRLMTSTNAIGVDRTTYEQDFRPQPAPGEEASTTPPGRWMTQAMPLPPAQKSWAGFSPSFLHRRTQATRDCGTPHHQQPVPSARGARGHRRRSPAKPAGARALMPPNQPARRAEGTKDADADAAMNQQGGPRHGRRQRDPATGRGLATARHHGRPAEPPMPRTETTCRRGGAGGSHPRPPRQAALLGHAPTSHPPSPPMPNRATTEI